MKILFLMRHGHSPSTAEAGVASDALRPLSDRGREEVRRVAHEIVARGGRPAIVLHSPLTRAAQTAATLAAALSPALGAEVFAALDNTRPPEEVLARLEAKAAGIDEVLAIGHQPQVGEIASLLTKSVFSFRPGGIIALETGKSPRVLWTLNAEDAA